MDGFRKLLVIAGIALAIIVAGVLIGILATTGSEVTVSHIEPPTPTESAPAPAGTVPARAESLPQQSPPRSPDQQPSPPPPLEAGGTNSLSLTNDWSERLDEILGADTPEREKAKQLLEMFPGLPKDGQEEVAQHLTNLVEDQDYASLGRYLTNSTLAEDVLDVLFSDLFNRPNQLKLPLLIDVARDAKHPKAGEAKDLLELYLEEDYGTDWAKWRAKAEQWLKDNPE